MMITDVKIRKIFKDHEKLEALVSVTFDNKFAVHDIKIIRGDNRTFVAMPSKRDKTGRFRDIVHPIEASAREQMENEVIEGYNKAKSEMDTE